MSYNGSGTFLINTAGQPVVSGTVISSTAFNALTADLATGLSTAITKDGQTTITANIPMANYKFTGLGVGSAAGDSANLSQVQSTAVKLLASVSGADTITAVGSPNVAAYVAGQMFYFVAAAANTGAVTINIDSLGAKNITRDGTTALAAGDIQSGEVCVIVYDGTQFQLVNGASQSASIVTENLTVNKATVLNESGGDNDTRIEGDTEANLMFVDASEDNIGIGTNSTDTTYRLTVQGVGTSGNPMGGICFRQGATDTLYVGSIATDNDTDVEIFNPRNGYIRFATNNLVHMLLDASGNLGLGVTPSAWDTAGGAALQVKNAALISYANQDVEVLFNTYFDGSNYKYISNGFATRYDQVSGTHAWFTAASGTAGNTISFTKAMTLDANGVLLRGNTTARSTNAFGTGEMQVEAAGYSAFQIFANANNVDGSYLGLWKSRGSAVGGTTIVQNGDLCGAVYFGGYDGTNAIPLAAVEGVVDGTPGANDMPGRIVFKTTSDGQGAMTERARITSGGEFLVGATAANAGSRLRVVGSGTSSSTYCTIFENSGAALLFAVQDDGRWRSGTAAASPYNYIVGATNRDLFVDNGGEIGYVSSVRASKTNIAPVADTDWLLQLNPVTFNFRKKDADGNYTDEADGPIKHGLIAEEVEAVNADLCFYDDEDKGGALRGVNYSHLITPMLKLIQKQQAAIAALEAKVAILEAK